MTPSFPLELADRLRAERIGEDLVLVGDTGGQLLTDFPYGLAP